MIAWITDAAQCRLCARVPTRFDMYLLNIFRVSSQPLLPLPSCLLRGNINQYMKHFQYFGCTNQCGTRGLRNALAMPFDRQHAIKSKDKLYSMIHGVRKATQPGCDIKQKNQLQMTRQLFPLQGFALLAVVAAFVRLFCWLNHGLGQINRLESNAALLIMSASSVHACESVISHG
jgi:hypothetical protein